MAFDMWFDCDNEQINCQISHEDERILRLAEGNTNFSTLTWLLDNFYNDPVIFPNIAKSLVVELNNLADYFAKNNRKQYITPCQKIENFIRLSIEKMQVIHCISD